MPRNFTLKLAVSNLKKNRKLYMPYIIASIIMIAVIYIMSFLSNSKDLENFRGANYVTLSMLLGNIIVSGFAIIPTRWGPCASWRPYASWAWKSAI